MSNANFSEKLTETIEANFSTALEQVAPNIAEILTANLADNDKSETGDQSTTLTVQAKIRINFTAPGMVDVTVTIPAKKIETVVGTASGGFDFNQDELPGISE